MTVDSITDVDQMKAESNFDGLIEALSSSKDDKVREAAAVALGQIGSAQVAGPLLRALNDSARNVRKAAVDALAKFGIYNAAGITILTTLIDLEAKTRRAWINTLLEKLGEPGAGNPGEPTNISRDIISVRPSEDSGTKLLYFVVGAVLWIITFAIMSSVMTSMANLSTPQELVKVYTVVFCVLAVILLGLFFIAFNGWDWLSGYKFGTPANLVKYMAFVILACTVVGMIPIFFWTGKGVVSRIRRPAGN
jgi:hypothetical protein